MPTLTTELDLVNDLLMAIGRTPRAAFSSAPADADEQVARAILGRHVQKLCVEQDWKFNYAERVQFTASGAGAVVLGTTSEMNILRVVMNETNPPVQGSLQTRDCEIQLDGTDFKLYDVVGRSFTTWGANAKVYLDVTYLRTLTQLPEAAKECVAARAKVQFLTERNGNPQVIQLAAQAAMNAQHILLRDHLYKAGTKVHRRVRMARSLLDNPTVASWLGGLPPVISPIP